MSPAAADAATVLESTTVSPHTCESGWLMVEDGCVTHEEICGAPATHQALHTCCTHVKYVCEAHAAGYLPGTTGEFCIKCSHSCPWGFCHHRVVVPL